MHARIFYYTISCRRVNSLFQRKNIWSRRDRVWPAQIRTTNYLLLMMIESRRAREEIWRRSGPSLNVCSDADSPQCEHMIALREKWSVFIYLVLMHVLFVGPFIGSMIYLLDQVFFIGFRIQELLSGCRIYLWNVGSILWIQDPIWGLESWNPVGGSGINLWDPESEHGILGLT